MVVVLDDIHLLHDQEGLDAVAVLVDHLPPGSQLAVISRGEPPPASVRDCARAVTLRFDACRRADEKPVGGTQR